MKVLSTLAILVFILTACASSQQSEDINDKVLIEHLNKESFKLKVFDYEANQEWKYIGKQPCIIDFYANWCAPCRILAPTLENSAEAYEGKIKVYKVDTDKEKELSAAFGIQSLPTLIFIPTSGNPYVHRGLLSKEDLDKLISEVLLPTSDK